MTVKQKCAFWRLFAAACANLGIKSREREDYRHTVMWEEASVKHLDDINNTTGFESVMKRLAVDAGDWAQASEFAAGDAKRVGAMINDCARQVFELTGHLIGDAKAYAQGILKQAGLARSGLIAGEQWYLDYPETTPIQVFQMLDSHRRRLIWRRRRETGTEIRLAYSFGTSYKEAM